MRARTHTHTQHTHNNTHNTHMIAYWFPGEKQFLNQTQAGTHLVSSVQQCLYVCKHVSVCMHVCVCVSAPESAIN